MPQSYSDKNKIYSVDMMFAYINLFKPPFVKILVGDLKHNLEYKGWGEPTISLAFSPLDVLNNPHKKIYEKDMHRIDNANLNYPIIVHNKYIVDGVHRLTKASLLNKKYIKAYQFDDNLMKHFLIDNKGNWDKVDKMQPYHFIELFCKQFFERWIM